MSAAFLQTFAAALPGAVVRVDGTLSADELVLDRPITLVGGEHGGLHTALIVRSTGVVLRGMTVRGKDGAAAVTVDGGSVSFEGCDVHGGSRNVVLLAGRVDGRGTTFRDSDGHGIDARAGDVRLENCTVERAGATALVVCADARVELDGVDIGEAGVGITAEGACALTATATRVHDCGVNLETRGGCQLQLADLDLGPAVQANFWLHGAGTQVSLARCQIHGAAQVAVSVTDGATLRLHGCSVSGGTTTLRVAAATASVEACRIGPATGPHGAELRIEAGAAVKLSASSVATTGFAWCEGTIVCLDASFEGVGTALAVRAPGTLRADGSSLQATDIALRLDGCDAHLERCHLFGARGLSQRGGALTLGRCEVHATAEGVGVDLHPGSTLTAKQSMFRGGAVVLSAVSSSVTLSEVKVTGLEGTRTGIEADENSPLSLTRCQVDAVEETAIRASQIVAESTHVLGGHHWGVRVHGRGARSDLRRCLIQAPVGFCALSVDGQAELVGCNLEGKLALQLGPGCRGAATRCGIRGTETGTVAFDYGVRFALDDCTSSAPVAVDYKRGYELTLRGGTFEGLVRVEDRRLALDGIDAADLELQVGPRGRVVAAHRPEVPLPGWCADSGPATQHLDAEHDWHRYHELLDAALADPMATVINIPESVATAPLVALTRRAGAADWPGTWRIIAPEMRALDDWLDLVATWIRGAFDEPVQWQADHLERTDSRSFEDGVRGSWSCGDWSLTGNGQSNDQGNPRDGYAFDVEWVLRRAGVEIFAIRRVLQGPYPSNSLDIEAPSVAPERCWRAAALVHAWAQTL
jgi:hypothetical protein